MNAAIATVGRAVSSFRPSGMPVLTRAHYRSELIASTFLPFMVGAIEGGVVGVIAKNMFAGIVPEARLNFAVALLAGAQAFANIASFFWASFSIGRHKIRFVVTLQLAVVALVASIAFLPANEFGLWMLCAAVVGSRICWSGVVTVRSTVWRVNYPRTARATVAGKLATIQAIVISLVGFLIGKAMDFDAHSFRIIYPVAAVCGILGAAMYSRLRVRGHRVLLRLEQEDTSQSARSLTPAAMLNVLRSDRPYRLYMLCMFLFGLGNLMLLAPLVIMLRDQFGMGYTGSIALTTTLPILFMAVSVPIWSSVMDRVHVVRFRAYHSWFWVAALATVFVGGITGQIAWLWGAAVLQGAAFGGGVLAWNLGHHDFAPKHQASLYMGVHVTLTGVRGMFAPMLAVGMYETFDSVQAGSGGWVFAVAAVISAMGASGFVLFARSLPESERRGLVVEHLSSPPQTPPAS